MTDRQMKGTTTANKNYMSIAVSVQNWKFTARNNGGAARLERVPKSATAYSSVRSCKLNKMTLTQYIND